jgi:hypothetical protein
MNGKSSIGDAGFEALSLESLASVIGGAGKGAAKPAPKAQPKKQSPHRPAPVHHAPPRAKAAPPPPAPPGKGKEPKKPNPIKRVWDSKGVRGVRAINGVTGVVENGIKAVKAAKAHDKQGAIVHYGRTVQNAGKVALAAGPDPLTKAGGAALIVAGTAVDQIANPKSLSRRSGRAAASEYKNAKRAGKSNGEAQRLAAGGAFNAATHGVAKESYDKARKGGDNKFVAGAKAATDGAVELGKTFLGIGRE